MHAAGVEGLHGRNRSSTSRALHTGASPELHVQNRTCASRARHAASSAWCGEGGQGGTSGSGQAMHVCSMHRASAMQGLNAAFLRRPWAKRKQGAAWHAHCQNEAQRRSWGPLPRSCRPQACALHKGLVGVMWRSGWLPQITNAASDGGGVCVRPVHAHSSSVAMMEPLGPLRVFMPSLPRKPERLRPLRGSPAWVVPEELRDPPSMTWGASKYSWPAARGCRTSEAPCAPCACGDVARQMHLVHAAQRERRSAWASMQRAAAWMPCRRCYGDVCQEWQASRYLWHWCSCRSHWCCHCCGRCCARCCSHCCSRCRCCCHWSAGHWQQGPEAGPGCGGRSSCRSSWAWGCH